MTEAGQEDPYETESEYSYDSVPPDEQEDGNLWRQVGALDMMDDVFDRMARLTIDRRFTDRPRYEQGLELARRRRRETDGVETVTLFRPVHMLS